MLAVPFIAATAGLLALHVNLDGATAVGLISTILRQQLLATQACPDVTTDLLLTPTASRHRQPGHFQPPQAFHLHVNTTNQTHTTAHTLTMRMFAAINIPVVTNMSVEDTLITVATKMFVETNIPVVTNMLPAGAPSVAFLPLAAVPHQTTLTV